MPPKKAVSDEPIPLGRFGTSLHIGLVGLPNVGKSTTFNVLTNSAAPAENYAFCTKDPNEAKVDVPDERFDWLVDFYKPKRHFAAALTVMDIAGLVAGAHEGCGLGNEFLANIQSCDAIFHVVRAFADEEVTHVEGDVNPVRDLDIIHNELRLKDLQRAEKLIPNCEKATRAKSNDKEAKADLACMLKCKDMLEAGQCVREGKWTAAEVLFLNLHSFLTAKPVIYLVNLSQKDYIRKKNKWLSKIKAWVDEHERETVLIPYCADLERELSELDQAAKDARLAEIGVPSMLNKIVTTGYDKLNLMYFFTTGEDEVKAWTIKKGTKAPQAAGKIHGDFEKGFQKAEVYQYSDFKELGSEVAIKAAGKFMTKGKDYIVQDGDVVHFKVNTAGMKK